LSFLKSHNTRFCILSDFPPLACKDRGRAVGTGHQGEIWEKTKTDVEEDFRKIGDKVG